MSTIAVPIYASFASGHTVEYSLTKLHDADVLVDRDFLLHLDSALTLCVFRSPREARLFAKGVEAAGQFHISADAGQLPSGHGAVLVQDSKAACGITFTDHRLDQPQETTEGFACSWSMTAQEFGKFSQTPYERVRARLDAEGLKEMPIYLDGSNMDFWVDGYENFSPEQMDDLLDIAAAEPPEADMAYDDRLNWMIERVESRAAEMRQTAPTL